MPTVTKSIGTNSRDYSTITLWEAAIDNTTYPDANTTAKGECYDDSAFDESVTINASASNVVAIELTVAAGHRHDGTAGTGARISRTASSEGILTWALAATPSIVSWLELTRSGASAFGGGVSMNITGSAALARASHLLVHSMSTSTSNNIYSGIFFTVSSFVQGVAVNNVLYDLKNTKADSSGSGSALSAGGRAASSAYHNNTIHGCGIFGASATGNFVGLDATNNANLALRNNLVTNSTNNGSGTVADFDAETNPTYSHNASSDATASGTGSLTSITTANQYVSTVVGSEDLHLKTGSDCINAGTDLGTTPTGVNLDIDGYDRDATGVVWDIGADEFVEAYLAAYGTSWSPSRSLPAVAARSAAIATAPAAVFDRANPVSFSGVLACSQSNVHLLAVGSVTIPVVSIKAKCRVSIGPAVQCNLDIGPAAQGVVLIGKRTV